MTKGGKGSEPQGTPQKKSPKGGLQPGKKMGFPTFWRDVKTGAKNEAKQANLRRNEVKKLDLLERKGG